MKYIPDAVKQVASLSLAIPMIIVIVGCLWVKKAVGRKHLRAGAVGRKEEIMAKDKGTKFVGPKSICECGHTGDGGGEHEDEAVYARGTGRCFKCDCKKFVWKGWTKKYQHFLAAQKNR